MNKAISATIITLNEEDTIQTCIQNVAQICDEVVVLDSYSKDKTAKAASIAKKKLGARVNYFHNIFFLMVCKKKDCCILWIVSNRSWIYLASSADFFSFANCVAIRV